MDLNTIESFERPRTRDALPRPAPGDAWLAGGTWLFSEPQPSLKRLVDLTALGWAPIEMQDDGVFVAATCPVATLEAFAYPSVWRAGPLISQCCHAFLASFKIWNAATVGGNICMALPAGPMISLGAALDATCLLWGPDGAERRMPVLDFVLGPQRTAIAPCELLRGIAFREAVLRRPAAFRRISLQAQGRSGAVVIGTRDEGGAIAITVTAATRRPHRLVLREPVGGDDLARRVDAEIGAAGWYDDIHGRPDWRRHMTIVFIEEIVAELAGAPS
jgi:CO/xanthine dehydrogenase FAD-binding subunit